MVDWKIITFISRAYQYHNSNGPIFLLKMNRSMILTSQLLDY